VLEARWFFGRPTAAGHQSAQHTSGGMHVPSSPQIVSGQTAQANVHNLQPELGRHAWRRVASTHRMEDLEAGVHRSCPPLRALLLGTLVMALAILISCLSSVVLLPVILRGSVKEREENYVYYVQAAAAWLPVSVLCVFVNWFCNKLFKLNA
jgi:hypothetical protein